MQEIQVQAAALVAPLAAIPLVSWGSTGGPAAATVVGALAMALGLASLTALHFVDLEDQS